MRIITLINYITLLFFYFGILNFVIAQDSELRVEFKNNSPIIASDLSPDNHFLVQIKDDNSILVWDLLNGNASNSIKGYKGKMLSVIITNDNQIIGGNNEGELYFWDIGTSTPITVLEGHTSEINEIQILDTIILTGGSDNLIKSWSLNSKKLINTFSGHTSKISAISVGKRNNEFISGSKNGEIIRWNLLSKDLFYLRKIENCSVESIVYCKDRRYFFTAGSDKYLRKWHLKTGNQVIEFDVGNSATNLELIDDNRLILCQSNLVNYWDINLNKIINDYGGHSSEITSFHKLKNFFISTSKDGLIKIISGSNFSEVVTMSGYKDNYVIISSNGYFDGNENGIASTKIINQKKAIKLKNQSHLKKKKDLLRLLLFGIPLSEKSVQKYKIDSEFSKSLNFSSNFLQKSKSLDAKVRSDTIEFCPQKNNELISLKLLYDMSSLSLRETSKIFDGSIDAVRNEFTDNIFSLDLSKATVIRGKTYLENKFSANDLIEVNPTGCLTFIIDRDNKGNTNFIQDGSVTLLTRKGHTLGTKKSKKIKVVAEPKQKNRALIFAIKDYQDKKRLEPIPNAFLGGDEIKKVLKESFNFEVGYYKNPTLDDFTNAIDSMVQIEFHPKDQLFIFFTGHGSIPDLGYSKEIGYLHFSDSNVEKRSTSLKHSSLAEDLNAMNCQHILVVLDACYSAIFGESIENASHKNVTRDCKYCNDEVNQEYIYNEELKEVSRLYLAAGEKKSSVGISTEINPFTKKFLKVLKTKNWKSERIAIDFDEIKTSLRDSGLNPIPKGGSFVPESGTIGNFIFYKKN